MQINHITLNTGHMRKTRPDEVDKKIYFVLKRIVRDALKNGKADLFDGYFIRLTESKIGYLVTVFNKFNVPILTTAISNSDDGSLWQSIHTTTNTEIVTDAKKPPALPYIADRLEVGIGMSLDATRWTGDFSRCMGWILLAPDKVR